MKNRNLNIDFLRVLSMLFIIIHHCIINDYGLQNILKGEVNVYSTAEFLILILINAIVVIGVNIFFLLSGWCRIKFKRQKLLKLLLKVYIIFGIIQISGFLTGYVDISLYNIYIIFKVIDYYWFIIVYILLMLISNELNIIIDTWTKKKFYIYCLFFIFIFCLYGFIPDSILHLNSGYSFFMAIALYLLGGGLKKYSSDIIQEINRCCKKNVFLSCMFMINVFINFLLIFILYYYGMGDKAWYLYSYNCIFVVLESVSILLLIVNLNIKFPKVVTRFACSTIVVYLIHSTCWLTIFRKIGVDFLKNYFGFFESIILLPAYAILIYLIALIIDGIYEYLYYKITDLISKK